MAFFPQIAHFPVKRRIARRTVLTEQPDGRVVKLADPDFAALEWTLSFEGLTAEEMRSIEELFTACEGRRGTFVFLDPLDNLLRWSEDLGASAWIRDAGIALTNGVADPLGGTGAALVTGAGQIRQTVQAPSGFEYCLSVWARSESTAEFALRTSAGEETSSRTFEAGPAWRRFEFATRLATQQDTVAFAVEVSGAVELFGMQADPQRGASMYKRTASRSGAYGEARFDQDVLEVQADGPNCHSSKVRVRAAAGD
jgi:hypothetical protein